ncbi:MAG: DUF4304 domain-containing protein [Candidatus Acidiferrum sp.]
MKERNFRVRGRTFNRRTLDGLTQVINFQMGRFDPPGTVHIPRLRENYYGQFTMNVGVFVPEVHMVRFGGTALKFIAEFDCCIRERLGMLAPERADIWWKIRGDDEESERLVDELRRRLERDAFPFLARLETRDALKEELLKPPENSLFPINRGRIICAIILAARGQLKDARDLLVAHRAEHIRDRGHPGHLKYLEELAVKLGIEGFEAS